MDHQKKKATAEPGEQQSQRMTASSARVAAIGQFIEQTLTRVRAGPTDGAAPRVLSAPPQRHS
jgi:hypothetical protein